MRHRPGGHRKFAPRLRVFVAAGAVLVSVFWFPHSLMKVSTLGYDFPLYVGAGKAVLEGGAFPYGWVYPDWTAWVFVPFTFLPAPFAFGLFYAISVGFWLALIVRVPWPVGVLSAYPALLGLEVGNIGVILAGACLTLPGAMAAGCFKPYLFAFVALHAFGRYAGVFGEGGWRVHPEADADLPRAAGGSSDEEPAGTAVDRRESR